MEEKVFVGFNYGRFQNDSGQWQDYCHPYTSCERGSNERQNRILRRYFPKGQSMAKVTQKDCDRAADAINSMPRKIFDYKSSADLFAAELAKLQSALS